MPVNGDVNPYGIANVPNSAGSLVRGDILISNFNDWENLQGTGTTIVKVFSKRARVAVREHRPVDPPGAVPCGVGLTTALAILPYGYVVVGSLPTANGKAATAQAGCLIVLNSAGHVVKTISGGPIDGPWDLSGRQNIALLVDRPHGQRWARKARCTWRTLGQPHRGLPGALFRQTALAVAA